MPYFLALLADANLYLGRISEGLSAMGVALEKAAKSGEHFWEAELYRIKGELLLMQANKLRESEPSGD